MREPRSPTTTKETASPTLTATGSMSLRAPYALSLRDLARLWRGPTSRSREAQSPTTTKETACWRSQRQNLSSRCAPFAPNLSPASGAISNAVLRDPCLVASRPHSRFCHTFVTFLDNIWYNIEEFSFAMAASPHGECAYPNCQYDHRHHRARPGNCLCTDAKYLSSMTKRIS